MKGKGFSKRTFKKGDQCVQNPGTRRHRDHVKKNVISQRKAGGGVGLTLAALQKHNEEIEEDLHMEDLAISETTATTKKSKAFSISGLTDCSNMTFNKVMDKWKSTDSMDQEKCAILAAVTEVIRSRGGSESETDYFAALMTLLESTTEESSCAAVLYLIGLVIKKVSSSVLKAKCSESLKRFSEMLEAHHETGRASLLMGILDCLSTLLTAQDPAIWTEQSTQRSFQMMLSFITHSKPKVRKLAHSTIQSILRLCLLNHKNHPCGTITSKYLIQIFSQHAQDPSNICHHALNFLKNCLHYFAEKQLKEICEAILQLIAINNPIIKTNSMQTLYSMFKANPSDDSLSADLNCKLIVALYDFQPSFNDVHVAAAWLAVELEAHSNLSLLDNALCLKHLPKFFGTALNFFQSEHKDVVKAAANYMKEASEKCMEPFIPTLEEDVTSKQSSFLKILKIMETGLQYKFQPVWHVVLQSLQYLYTTYGRIFPNEMVPSVINIIHMYSDPNSPFSHNLKKAISAAFTAIGPRLILDKFPLELVKDRSDLEFPQGWLLPIMKDSIKETELQYFIDEFLPIAAHLRQRGEECRRKKEDLEAKVYETLLSQVWSLLAGFCNNPTDVQTAFLHIAKVLGTALMEQKELRPLVIHALRNLIETTSEEDAKCISKFAKNFLPIYFNLYTSDEESCKGIALQVLDGIRTFLLVTDTELTIMFLDRSLKKLEEEKETVKKHQLMDLVVSMVKYSDESHLNLLHVLTMKHIESKDKSMQKKSYRILEEMLQGNSETCKKHVADRFDEIKSLLADSLSSAAPSSKAPRLRCLSCLLKRLSKDQRGFLQVILPEVILCTKEVGVKAKNAAFDLIVDIGTAIVFLSDKSKEECIEEYFTMVMAGLAGSPHMISGTLLAFTKLVYQHRYCLADKLIGSLLEAAILLLKHKTSEVVKASLIFVRALIKILNANELTGHLEKMIENLFVWSANCRSAHRQQIRIILERLDKKCGYATIRPMVPEQHRKFIVQIHKQLERNKRKKDDKKNADYEEEDDEDEQKEKTWDDILADSADEDENNGPAKKRVAVKGKRKVPSTSSTWIMEGEETLDLMDPKIAQNIVGTRPKLRANKRSASSGFEMSSDGKMMINDDENKEGDGGEKPLDIGQQDILAGFDKAPKQLKAGKRKLLEDMPEMQEERERYQPGGRGIHRNREMDDEDDEPKKRKKFGDEYKAKKAGGDVKLKGKPDPFAYIPLDRAKLNKRKRVKLSGQFTSMVKATKRGVAQSKGHKKHKK